MSTDPDTAAQIAEWRRKILADEYTDDELKEFVRVTRQGRVAASITSAKSRKGPEAPLNLDSLMNDIEAL